MIPFRVRRSVCHPVEVGADSPAEGEPRLSAEREDSMTEPAREETGERSPFERLGLSAEILRAVEKVGYEAPSPIQAKAIPVLLEGRDLIGQAQTGTGKTAAFALPLLAAIDLEQARPQMLVLTPTRELALQVSEAIQTYAHDLPGLHVLPVYRE